MFESFPLWLQGLFVALITLGAGGSLFIYTLNRKLSHVEFLHRGVLLGGLLGAVGLATFIYILVQWLAGDVRFNELIHLHEAIAASTLRRCSTSSEPW